MQKLKQFFLMCHPLYWPAWLALSILWLITRLPFMWQMNIGKGLGKVIYWISPKLRQTASVNIRLCFPTWTPAEQNALLKKNFASLGIGMIEAGIAWFVPDAKLKYRYQIIGYEYVEAALRKGKGIILIGPHFTCLELIGRLLGLHHSFGVMYRPHKKPFISFIHRRFREKHYVNYIPSHRVQQLLNALQNNMPIWYAYDIDGGKKRSVFAPLFGIQTATLTSVSRIAKLSGTTLIPISFYRCDNEFRYEIVLSPPIENFPSQDMVQDATRLNQVIETEIRRKPEQYIWQYKRFKTRPAGDERFY